MRFVKTTDSSTGQQELLDTLIESLNKGKVLWIISGGSNIEIEVNVLNQIDDSLSARLNILLSDERYGPKGHKDSNYQQLINSGFNVKSASFPDILGGNLSPEETVDQYRRALELFTSESDIVIGQFGIGEDGHIAGVLPYSLAVYSAFPVVYYESKPFNRLTLSLKALKDIDRAFVFCFGDNKQSALKKLKQGDNDIEALPSLILKEITDVTVYNDQI